MGNIQGKIFIMGLHQEFKDKCFKISGTKVNLVQTPMVIEIMEAWIKNKSFGNYIVISNANDIVMSRKDIKVKEAINYSSLSVPDGFSLLLFARICGFPLKKRVYGPDLMLEFLEISENKGYSHFFYGAMENTLEKLASNLSKKIPSSKIAGYYSPPFRELSVGEDEEIIDIINNASPDVLWVGLGCPKQQLWMYEHKDKIKVPVMVGAGAAFDFISGVKRQAPRWIRDSGFEWLFRLVTEPKRLWKRYLIGNAIFIGLILKELFNRQRLKND